jgi:hypothetical protein
MELTLAACLVGGVVGIHKKRKVLGDGGSRQERPSVEVDAPRDNGFDCNYISSLRSVSRYDNFTRGFGYPSDI